MSYVLVGILFLLIASAFVTYLVLSATRRSNPARADDQTVADRGDTGAPGIGADQSPLGDTEEHAEHDAEQHGPTPGDRPAGRFQRDPIGGEAEARPFTGRSEV